MTTVPIKDQLGAAAGRREGVAQARKVLGRLGTLRLFLWTTAGRLAVEWFLEGRSFTSDEVKRSMPKPPPSVKWLFLGSVFKNLVEHNVCRVVGHVRSAEPRNHGRHLPLWALADRAAAVAWLEAHPPVSEPPADGSLFSVSDFSEAR